MNREEALLFCTSPEDIRNLDVLDLKTGILQFFNYPLQEFRVLQHLKSAFERLADENWTPCFFLKSQSLLVRLEFRGSPLKIPKFNFQINAYIGGFLPESLNEDQELGISGETIADHLTSHQIGVLPKFNSSTAFESVLEAAEKIFKDAAIALPVALLFDKVFSQFEFQKLLEIAKSQKVAHWAIPNISRKRCGDGEGGRAQKNNKKTILLVFLLIFSYFSIWCL